MSTETLEEGGYYFICSDGIEVYPEDDLDYAIFTLSDIDKLLKHFKCEVVTVDHYSIDTAKDNEKLRAENERLKSKLGRVMAEVEHDHGMEYLTEIMAQVEDGDE